MAEIDRAVWRYRAPIEAWWWLERRVHDVYSVRVRSREIRGLDPDSDVPALLGWAQSITYRRRKRAERAALRSLGFAQPDESRFPPSTVRGLVKTQRRRLRGT